MRSALAKSAVQVPGRLSVGKPGGGGASFVRRPLGALALSDRLPPMRRRLRAIEPGMGVPERSEIVLRSGAVVMR